MFSVGDSELKLILFFVIFRKSSTDLLYARETSSGEEKKGPDPELETACCVRKKLKIEHCARYACIAISLLK